MPVRPSRLQLPLSVQAYDGSFGWLGRPLISGSWYRGTSEVDVNTAFLTQTGLMVGDRVALTLAGTAADVAASGYDVGLKPGTSAPAYARALGRVLGLGFSVGIPYGSAGLGGGGSGNVAANTALIRLLKWLIAVLAGLGVLNSVLMRPCADQHDRAD